jgi:hypothetical protein
VCVMCACAGDNDNNRGCCWHSRSQHTHTHTHTQTHTHNHNHNHAQTPPQKPSYVADTPAPVADDAPKYVAPEPKYEKPEPKYDSKKSEGKYEKKQYKREVRVRVWLRVAALCVSLWACALNTPCRAPATDEDPLAHIVSPAALSVFCDTPRSRVRQAGPLLQERQLNRVAP